ncbi:MAG: hypothetical protein R2742_09235 [Micropruina glycogenica]
MPLTEGLVGTVGFDAITVALLGRSKPVGIVLAGLLFGGLSAGGLAMQSVAQTPLTLTLVLQALVVLFVAAPRLVATWCRSSPRARRAPHDGSRRMSTATHEPHVPSLTDARKNCTSRCSRSRDARRARLSSGALIVVVGLLLAVLFFSTSGVARFALSGRLQPRCGLPIELPGAPVVAICTRALPVGRGDFISGRLRNRMPMVARLVAASRLCWAF